MSEVEIVILPKFNSKNTYLYISNYFHRADRQNVKICHYPKDENRIVLPMTAIDILFLVLNGMIPSPENIKQNIEYRRQYLETVDYHIDKVNYIIENRVPIETGIARNVKLFDTFKGK